MVCVSVSVTTLAATSFPRYHTLLYGVFLDFDSQISLKRLLSIEITPAVLDTARIDIEYEALAILLTITKVERLS